MAGRSDKVKPEVTDINGDGVINWRDKHPTMSKVADFFTKDDPNSQQVKNAAMAIGGQGDSGGTVDTRGAVFNNTDAGQKLVAAQAQDQANRDLNGTEAQKVIQETPGLGIVPEQKAGDGTVENDNLSANIETEAANVANKDPKARYKMGSIWDAFKSGAIDANTRDYLMLDAIRTSVNNFAQDQGKIAAAYGGGSYDANYQDSAWDQRNDEMMRQGVSSEAATVEGSDKDMERQLQNVQIAAGKLSNKQRGYMLAAADNIKKLYNRATTDAERTYLAALMSKVASGQIDEAGMIGIGGASSISALKEIFGGDKK